MKQQISIISKMVNERKIGLVVVTNHNYGSILQSFALQQAIRSIGCSTEIVNYQEEKKAKIKRLQNFEYAISRVKIIYKQIMMRLVHPEQKRLLNERTYAFRDFIDGNFYFSKKCVKMASLTELATTYNVVMVGSDQVWHPMNLRMNFFTLNFVPDGVKKGAYAPSFGVSIIPDPYRKPYAEYINRIEYVSCRERAGVKLIKELTGREVPMVCDPTLLLTAQDWDKFLSDKIKIKEKYVFCYFIGNNPNQREVVKEYAKVNGLKVVALLHIDEYIASDENYADYTPYNVGPAEFLYLVKNAECVMTDSFHASVFSLQFHRNFYTFNRFENGNGNSTTSRIDSLLSTANVMDRKVKNGASISDLPKTVIDYKDIDERLKQFRASSEAYLKTIVG